MSPFEGSVRPCVDQKLVGESCTVAGPCNDHYIMSIYYHQKTSEKSINLTCNVDIVHVSLGNLCPDLGYEVQDELNIVGFTLLRINIPVGTNVSTPLHNISNPLSSPASLVTIRSHDDTVIS